jgi:PAS domain S-box-containing protein
MATQVPGIVYQFYARPNGEFGFYYVSDRSERIVGLKADLGGYFERFTAQIIPEYREGFIESIKKSVKELSEWNYEGILQKPTGERIWFSGSSTPTLRENEIVFNGIVQDITERKKAQEKLVHFQKALENSIDAVGMSTSDGRHYYQNAAFTKLFGFSVNEVNDALRSLTTIYVDEQVGRNIFETIMKGDAWIGEVEMLTKDKRKVDISLRAYAIKDGEGKVIGLVGVHTDITEKKRSEELLRASEERYRALFIESRDAIMTVSLEKGFLSGNPVAVKMFECRNEEDFKAKTPADLSPEFQPDGSRSIDKSRKMMMLAMEKGSNFFEWTHKRVGGGEFFATVLLSRLENSGKILLQATVRDISEQKRADQALKKSQAWFSTTLISIGDAVITVDNQGNITFINPVAQRLTGWLESESVGKHIDEVFVIRKENTDQKVENPVLKVLSNGQIAQLANHTTLVSKDGSRCAIDDSAAPIKDVNSQEIIGVVLVFRDVTNRNKIEKELRELSVAVEQSPACVVITDLKGDIQYVNPKFVQLTGYTFAEVKGKNPRILKSGEQSVEFYKGLWDTITRGDEWHGEFHNKNKNGELYWESASISAIRNKDGEITNFIAAKEDITKRKEILKELEVKNIELKKLDQLKSDFVSIVSHELRTPLAITKEGISLILDGVIGNINSKQSKILTTSKNNIDRLARIINSLLDISKIESGRVELKKTKVNLLALIRNVISLFALKAKEKGLELKVELPKDEEVNLYVDEDRIIQVFTNLIGNALKFTEKGSVTISLTEKQDEIECMVSDTGSGIAPEDRPHVFNKFMQFGRVSGAGEKGTGLGLSIAKGLIELHRGRIWIESKFNLGSKFIFTLPKYSIEQIGRAQIEDAINNALKTSEYFSLIVVTLRYSDRIKSEVSAEILAGLDKAIANELHKGKDSFSRFANEFFIVLQDCNKSCALIVQGRIQQVLKNYFNSIHLDNDVKVDFGSATYPDEANSYQELINKARQV